MKKNINATVLLVLVVCCIGISMKADAAWKKSAAGNYRYYTAAGTLLKERWVGNYYVDKRGIRVINQWIKKSGKNVFVGNDGKLISNFKGGFHKIDGKWYYYSKKGELQKGWVTYRGKKYYFDKKNGTRQHGYRTIKGKKYYFNLSTGVLQTAKWVGDNYLGKNGYVTKTLPEKSNIKMNYLMQNPELPTGCESVALTIALKYYGFHLSKTTIVDFYLDYSSVNFVSAFIGNPRSSSGAGCYAPAIKNAANRFLNAKKSKMRAENITGTPFSQLYRYVSEKNPVIVWNTMYMLEPKYTDVTYTEGGKTYRWYGREHCVVLCGYDIEKNTVTINDPLEGIVKRNAKDFEDLYNKMGKMAVIIK